MKKILVALTFLPLMVCQAGNPQGSCRDILVIGKTGYGDIKIPLTVSSNATCQEVKDQYRTSLEEYARLSPHTVYSGFLSLHPYDPLKKTRNNAELQSHVPVFGIKQENEGVFYMAG